MKPLWFCIPGAVALLPGFALAQVALPTDVQQTCTVENATFNSWFSAGAPSPDGAVLAADSALLPVDSTVCDFYKWGAQMFLWLTSPEGDGRVLDSTALFNVLPADDTGKRYLQENTPGTITNFAVRAEKFDNIGEVGQAGSSGVLLSQGGSLVYYGVHVNDLYGYFLTGQNAGMLDNMVDFPRNLEDLAAVVLYARDAFPSATIEDPRTLAMEFKTSWVEASTVPDPSQFVTIQAEIPTYSANSDNTEWTPSGFKTTTLALVGMHIVGTVQNHPEFIWITYEHILNAPDASYYYMNSTGAQVQQPYSSDGTFLFMQTGGAMPQNIECAKVNQGKLVANKLESGAPYCAGGIVASDTYRKYPWGSASDDPSQHAVTNNTLLLSVNQSIRAQLSQGDVRANYLQTGGIWTTTPDATDDAPIPDASGYSEADLRGSLFAFNATMETYTQGTSCFSCHAQSATAPNSFQPFELSHIYSQIVPLVE